MSRLRPAAWRNSAVMGVNANGVASAKAALWMAKRSSIGDWATEMQQDISHGVGCGRDGGLHLATCGDFVAMRVVQRR